MKSSISFAVFCLIGSIAAASNSTQPVQEPGSEQGQLDDQMWSGVVAAATNSAHADHESGSAQGSVHDPLWYGPPKTDEQVVEEEEL